MPTEFLCGRVANVRFDIARLKAYYDEFVSPSPATLYHDHEVAYHGWSLTSRDGTTADGVKRIDRRGSGDTRKGTLPTPLCRGYAEEVIRQLNCLGFKPHRIRIMRLADDGFDMKWHRDANVEAWRLHVPIVTNEHCYFEWRLEDGRERRVHLMADGYAWLVRVDALHRAVNKGTTGADRVHLLMSLSSVPSREYFADPLTMTA